VEVSLLSILSLSLQVECQQEIVSCFYFVKLEKVMISPTREIKKNINPLNAFSLMNA
jgi:hypothetical protein